MARARLLPFAVTVFTSSFLLFQIQPIIAKIILPWFGGSAAVWTVCLLFFQVLLLAGYFYAHWLVRSFEARTQAWIHAGLLLLSLLALPVIPGPGWKPAAGDDPTLRILGLLAFSTGAPYLLLSTTSPLIQAWYTRHSGGALPYRLFALSNIASLAALLAYPVLIEPWIAARRQAVIWSVLYAAFVLLTAGLAIYASRGDHQVDYGRKKGVGPSKAEYGLWAVLAACSSGMLLAVTNYLCQNIASIPFLWILPLSVYLLSFILCFDSEGWYRPQLWLWITAAAIGAMSWALLQPGWSIKVVIPLFAVAFFVICMYCHGELARRKPAPEHLTAFYLMISFGGAVGAVLVSLFAPRLFRAYYELAVGVVACAFLVLFMVYRKWWVTDVVWAAVAIGAVVSARVQIRSFESDNRVMVRNFYGSLRVRDSGPEVTANMRIMVHGVISHGSQFLIADRRREPTTYYGRQSGIGLAIEGSRGPGQRVGVIGLGAGTMAVYARPQDSYRFYEINPQVMELARSEFTYLSGCRGTCEVVLGDARLSLERETPQRFDLLAVDAFSSDSIPVHLLSREAFELYFRHLNPNGLLALHISNTSLELGPVVQRIAESLGKQARRIATPGDPSLGTLDTVWVLVSSMPSTFEMPLLAAARPLPPRPDLEPWTDDYSNLFQVLK